MSRSLAFSRVLVAHLRRGSIQTDKGHRYVVRGNLDIGVAYATVAIGVPWLFRNVKRDPPRVYCDAPWMKTGVDWHNGPPLCWIFYMEWRDAMNWKGKQVNLILSEGSELLFNNVRCLLNRHYTADVEGLTQWDPAWDFVAHYFREGRVQYERERRLKESEQHRRGRRRGRQRTGGRVD